jgi:hypothetical protein
MEEATFGEVLKSLAILFSKVIETDKGQITFLLSMLLLIAAVWFHNAKSAVKIFILLCLVLSVTANGFLLGTYHVVLFNPPGGQNATLVVSAAQPQPPPDPVWRKVGEDSKTLTTGNHNCDFDCRGEPTRTGYSSSLSVTGDNKRLANPRLSCVTGPCGGWREVTVPPQVSADGKTATRIV